MKTKLTRRRMLKDSAKFAIGSTILMNLPFPALAGENELVSKVVLIRDEALTNEAGTINSQVLKAMLDNALVKLTQAKSAGEAWKKVIRSGDVVGIKSNHWRELRTPPELEEIIKTRVMEVGVGESNISVNDRNVLNDPVFKRATALINVRPSRAHAWSGVGSMLKNYIMFTPQPSSYHDDSCADLAKLWMLPAVKDKTRLNILVMITPLFHLAGSGHLSKEFTWSYKGIVVGFDPVAVDSVGVKILQAKRKEYFKEERPLNPPAKHIMLADTRHHLGNADFSRIDLIKTGWTEGMLI